jgi:hypothetical protein
MQSSTAALVPPTTPELATEETTPLTSSAPSSLVPAPRPSKANQAAPTPYEPARLIVHRDFEEIAPQDNVIELPPQYSEGRQPLTFRETAGHASSSSQSSYRP